MFEYAPMYKILCFVGLCIVMPELLFAQPVIKGKVIDGMNNQPIEGVSVSGIKSQSRGITDSHGNFTIHTTLQTDSLLVSFVGYNSLRLPVSAVGSIVALIPSF